VDLPRVLVRNHACVVTGGIARLQHHASRDKLDLLKMSLWSGGKNLKEAEANEKTLAVGEKEVHTLEPARRKQLDRGFSLRNFEVGFSNGSNCF
jgi:hypothetical protein